jgi:hypothetical protein
MCDGAWGCVANVFELPATSIFIKEELSCKIRINMTTRMWWKPKLINNIVIYLLNSLLMITDCY